MHWFAISKEYAENNVMAQQSFSVQGVFKNQREGDREELDKSTVKLLL
jgi:hypothetical protein